MKLNRSIRDLIRPRKTVLIAFTLLWVIALQYFLFILLFPDGGLSTIRSVLNGITDILLTPLRYVQVLFEPWLEYDRFPGYVSVPLLSLYFYLLAVVMALTYETVFDRGASLRSRAR